MTDFYDNIATEYDRMVGGAGRAAAAARFIAETVLAESCGALLDVACGTGVYALAAAGGGIATVHGIDLSTAMLAEARRNADAQGVTVQFHAGSMQDIPSLRLPSFDVILCMGNSLPHLASTTELTATLRAFRTALRRGGRAYVQLLNYDAVLARRERIVDATRDGDIEYIRFYDFLPGGLSFNLLRLDWRAAPPRTRIETTRLTPFRQQELAAAFAAAGFTAIECRDGLSTRPYDLAASPTLTVAARRD